MKKVYYYLFGSYASNLYVSEPFEKVLKELKKKNSPHTWQVHEHREGKDSSIDLLEAYDGYEGFTTIMRHEYYRLKPTKS